jgi:hypothetical protein
VGAILPNQLDRENEDADRAGSLLLGDDSISSNSKKPSAAMNGPFRKIKSGYRSKYGLIAAQFGRSAPVDLRVRFEYLTRF